MLSMLPGAVSPKLVRHCAKRLNIEPLDVGAGVNDDEEAYGSTATLFGGTEVEAMVKDTTSDAYL